MKSFRYCGMNFIWVSKTLAFFWLFFYYFFMCSFIPASRIGNIWCNEAVQGWCFNYLPGPCCIHGCISSCCWFQREEVLHAQWEGDDPSATWNFWRQSKFLVAFIVYKSAYCMCTYLEIRQTRYLILPGWNSSTNNVANLVLPSQLLSDYLTRN